MSVKFAVSRATVREGYRALIDAGYLSRLHGKGTYVTRVPQRHALDLNVSYTAMIQAAGFTPSIRIISQSVQPADDADRARLRLDRGAAVVVVERVRFADDRPVVYSVDRVPLALVPEAINGNLGPSLFDLLENLNHGVRNGRAKLLPVLAGPPEAAQLQVNDGVPLLYFDEVDYDDERHPRARLLRMAHQRRLRDVAQPARPTAGPPHRRPHRPLLRRSPKWLGERPGTLRSVPGRPHSEGSPRQSGLHREST